MINLFESPEGLEARVKKLEEEVLLLRDMVSILQSDMAILYDVSNAVSSIPRIQQVLDNIKVAFD